jgi:hypothetical protein
MLANPGAIHKFPSPPLSEIFFFTLLHSSSTSSRLFFALPALPRPLVYFSVALDTDRSARITCCIWIVCCIRLGRIIDWFGALEHIGRIIMIYFGVYHS